MVILNSPFRNAVTAGVVVTQSVANITPNSASVVCGISSFGGSDVMGLGVAYSTSQNPTINDFYVDADLASPYTCNLSNLSANTTYYVRAFINTDWGIAYGNQLSFTTTGSSAPVIVVPTVNTGSVSSITQTTATVSGSVTSTGGASSVTTGVCISTSPSPTTANYCTLMGLGVSGFNASITGMLPNTTYYARAYATNSAGTAYGSQISFTTTATLPGVVLPSVSTGSVSSIAQTTAIVGVTVTGLGNASSATAGVCWGTSSSPTISNSKISNPVSSTGSFNANLTGLTANTTYYIRAYITNSAGTAYGAQTSFTTTSSTPTTPPVTTCPSGQHLENGACVMDDALECPSGYTLNNFGSCVADVIPPSITTPTVSTTAVSAIAQTTATSGGYIVSTGGAAITARGVCWATDTDYPTTDHPHTSNGSGTGSFVSNLTGLLANTRYFVRAYATNSMGTSYGSAIQFYTIATGGTVVLTCPDGYHEENGVCIPNIVTCLSTQELWNGTCVTKCPTGYHRNSSTGYCDIDDCPSGQTRINGVCTPNVALGTVSTGSASSIAQTTAIVGVTVSSLGNASSATAGVCWGTSSSPTISNSKISNPVSSTGSFNANLTGLTANTTYYIRAYITNSAGTAYGSQISFTTTAIPCGIAGYPNEVFPPFTGSPCDTVLYGDPHRCSSTEPPVCQIGYHLNSSNICVIDVSDGCPTGEMRDPATGACVCKTGYHEDASGSCIPNAANATGYLNASGSEYRNATGAGIAIFSGLLSLGSSIASIFASKEQAKTNLTEAQLALLVAEQKRKNTLNIILGAVALTTFGVATYVTVKYIKNRNK